LLTSLLSDDFPVDASAGAKLKDQGDPRPLLDGLAAAFAKTGSWDAATLEGAIAEAATSLGVKKGALMFPCRVALTGQPGGFGLVTVLENLGRERTLARLRSFS